jgi:hypothetical protein
LKFRALNAASSLFVPTTYSDFHMGKPQMLCRALGTAKPLRNDVADATENGCKSVQHDLSQTTTVSAYSKAAR